MNHEEIELIAQRAIELHHEGNSCAQSVACATCHLAGLDATEAFRAMEGFGGGMGGFDQTCGALSGGALTLGYAKSAGAPDKEVKKAAYEAVSQFIAEFAQKHEGQTLCATLRLDDPDARHRACDEYIAECARLVAERF